MKKYIFVAGFGRSGSSIFDLYMNKQYNFFSVGELKYFFERGVENKELCSCGKTVFECDFWSKVIENYGKDDLITNAALYSKLTTKYESTLKFYLYILFKNKISKNHDFNIYINAHIKLIDSILQNIEPDVNIIDSSKFASRAFWLYNTKFSKNIYILHIIRNATANAYSCTKVKLRPEASYSGKKVYMDIFGYWEAFFKWLNNNIAASLLRVYFKEKYSMFHYEDFCKNSENVIKNNFTKIGLEECLNEGIINQSYHSISGNPHRLESKTINIKCDDTWKSKVSTSKKVITSIVSFPFYLILKIFEK